MRPAHFCCKIQGHAIYVAFFGLLVLPQKFSGLDCLFRRFALYLVTLFIAYKPMKTKIIAVTNQKGGVGKSTLAFHIAHAAVQAEGGRALCLDLDSQGNLSQYMTGQMDVIDDTEGGVGLLFDGKPFTPTRTMHPQIDLLHGHSKLDRYDSDHDAEERAYSPDMQALLRGLGYDFVIIDTPPAVGLRQLAALFWADVAVIPMEPVMSAIGGFQNVLNAIDQFIAPINPGLRWVGVMNRANMRVKSQREKDAWIREKYGALILATLASRSAVSDAMEESPAQPVWLRKGASKALREQWRLSCEQVLHA